MSTTTRSARPRSIMRVAVIAVLAVLAATSCSVEESLTPPQCFGGSSLIAAQSVPTAQLLPCFGGLPEGWSFATVMVNQSGTVVTLDSDRAGEGAATLRFEESCDVGRAASLPSPFEDVEHFEEIEQLQPSFRAHSYLRFDGGCVTWAFDFEKGASATESVALEEVLEFVTREDVNNTIRETFVDEDL